MSTSEPAKILFSPQVYLVGRQDIDHRELNRFLEDHGASWQSDSGVAGEALSETAGRLCYMSYKKPRPGGNKAYTNNILESRHGSVLEHAVWNFIFSAISRSLTHELVRHRAGFAYSQLSQRYVDESECAFVCPPALRKHVFAHQLWSELENLRKKGDQKLLTPGDARRIQEITNLAISDHHGLDGLRKRAETYQTWLDTIQVTQNAYQAISNTLTEEANPVYKDCANCGGTGRPDPPEDVGACPVCHGKRKFLYSGIEDTTARRKHARQTARSVLPNSTETMIFCTANARAIRHFIEMRCNRHADDEIRILAGKLYRLMRGEAPNLFGDYEEVLLEDGTFEVRTKNLKV